MAPVAIQSPSSEDDNLARVHLQPAVYVHAPAKISVESHITIATDPINLGAATALCVWFFDTVVSRDILTAAFAQLLQANPVFSGRIVEISHDGHVKVELSNEGVPLAEGQAASVTINDIEQGKISPPTPRSTTSSADSTLTAFLPLHTPLTTEAFRNERAPLAVASYVHLADGASALAVRFWSHLFNEREGVDTFVCKLNLPDAVTPIACCVLTEGNAKWIDGVDPAQKLPPAVAAAKVAKDPAYNSNLSVAEDVTDFEVV
ncbi:hypothetical protein HDU86_006602 [Geranomyces michiganensis]|nr:hypothetical protein HDU86_006602 [Geranomyces michiganensis]